MSGTSSNSALLPPRSKNAVGNRTDIGWKHGTDVSGNGKKVKCNYCSKIFNGGIFRFKHHLAGTRYDSEPCVSVPEEIKDLMLKVVSEAKDASLKKRKLKFNSFGQTDGEEEDSESISSKMFKSKSSSSHGVQATLNQMYKRGDKEKVDAQVAEFFYTSANGAKKLDDFLRQMHHICQK